MWVTLCKIDEWRDVLTVKVSFLGSDPSGGDQRQLCFDQRIKQGLFPSSIPLGVILCNCGTQRVRLCVCPCECLKALN